MTATSVRRLSPADLEDQVDELAQLLIDVVNDGFPMGFLAPLAPATACAYWLSLRSELQSGARLLLVARNREGMVGTGQLALSPWSNSPHRAELQKIMVNGAARGVGVGRALIEALHDAAWQRGRSLLVLNTRHGERAQALYRSLGYREAGVIPGWTIGSGGERYDHATLYLQLT